VFCFRKQKKRKRVAPKTSAGHGAPARVPQMLGLPGGVGRPPIVQTAGSGYGKSVLMVPFQCPPPWGLALHDAFTRWT